MARDYEKLGADIGRLVSEKQIAYGDSFGKAGEVVRILYPAGIPPEKLDDALTLVRVLDKLFRIATDRDALGESPWRDIAGYALLSAERIERKRHEAEAVGKTFAPTPPGDPFAGVNLKHVTLEDLARSHPYNPRRKP